MSLHCTGCSNLLGSADRFCGRCGLETSNALVPRHELAGSDGKVKQPRGGRYARSASHPAVAAAQAKPAAGLASRLASVFRRR